MSDPQTFNEYVLLYHGAHRVEGEGLDVIQHMPCPFCAHPDWLVHKVVESREAFSRGATCSECGRSARALYTDTPGGLAMEFVQTGGPDAPGWMDPKMRRLPEIKGGLDP